MEYIRVVNFERCLHYKARNPIWFKLYLDLLDEYKFTELEDKYKWIVVGLHILAAKTSNKLPTSEKFLKKKLHIKGGLNLEVLIKAGFIEYLASNVLATCYQDASLDKKRIDKIRKEEEPPIVPHKKIKKIEKPERTKKVTPECVQKLKLESKAVDVDSELVRFYDYCAANGKCYKNNDAAFRNWMSSPYQKLPKAGYPKKLTPNQETYRRLREKQQPPTDAIEITGESDE